MIEGTRASRGGEESPQDEARQESRSQVIGDFWGQSKEFRGPGNWDLRGDRDRDQQAYVHSGGERAWYGAGGAARVWG